MCYINGTISRGFGMCKTTVEMCPGEAAYFLGQLNQSGDFLSTPKQ